MSKWILALLFLAAPVWAGRIDNVGVHSSYAESTVYDVWSSQGCAMAVGVNEGVPLSPPPQRGFMFNHNVRLDLFHLDGYRDAVTHGTDGATRCGWASTWDDSDFTAVWWRDGNAIDLGGVAAYAVDGDLIVGTDGTPCYWYDGAGPYTLGGSTGRANDIRGDWIVGSMDGYPFAWEGLAAPTLLSIVPGEAVAISGAGVLGRRGTELGYWSEPQVWCGLPDNWTEVGDISDAGRIVGVADGQAAVWTEADGTEYLSDWLVGQGVSLEFWDSLTEANCISADGLMIGGQGWTMYGRAEGFVAYIPEPGSLVLLLLGAAVWRRR